MQSARKQREQEDAAAKGKKVAPGGANSLYF